MNPELAEGGAELIKAALRPVFRRWRVAVSTRRRAADRLDNALDAERSRLLALGFDSEDIERALFEAQRSLRAEPLRKGKQ